MELQLDEILKLKGRPAEIPGASRNDLPDFFKRLGFKVGVEVGVYKGDYTEVIAQSGLRIYGVDPWKIYRDYGNPRGQRRLDDQYRMALEKLAPYPNAQIIRKTSMEAVQDFEDESLDFVYIDANHLFRHVADDIYEWSFKVKQGGIISGHDYAYFKSQSLCGGCYVHQIVDAFVKSYNIDFWILGKRGEIDKFRSWMWFKNYRTPVNIIRN